MKNETTTEQIKVSTTVCLTLAVRADLDRAAAAEGRSRSWAAERAISAWLDRHPCQDKAA